MSTFSLFSYNEGEWAPTGLSLLEAYEDKFSENWKLEGKDGRF